MNDGVTSKMAPMVVYRARRLCLREGLDSANATNAPTRPLEPSNDGVNCLYKYRNVREWPAVQLAGSSCNFQ